MREDLMWAGISSLPSASWRQIPLSVQMGLKEKTESARLLGFCPLNYLQEILFWRRGGGVFRQFLCAICFSVVDISNTSQQLILPLDLCPFTPGQLAGTKKKGQMVPTLSSTTILSSASLMSLLTSSSQFSFKLNAQLVCCTNRCNRPH